MFPIIVGIKITEILDDDIKSIMSVGETWYATYLGNQPDEADKVRKMKLVAKSFCEKHNREILIHKDDKNLYGVSVTCPNRRFKITPRAIM